MKFYTIIAKAITGPLIRILIWGKNCIMAPMIDHLMSMTAHQCSHTVSEPLNPDHWVISDSLRARNVELADPLTECQTEPEHSRTAQYLTPWNIFSAEKLDTVKVLLNRTETVSQGGGEWEYISGSWESQDQLSLDERESKNDWTCAGTNPAYET